MCCCSLYFLGEIPAADVKYLEKEVESSKPKYWLICWMLRSGR